MLNSAPSVSVVRLSDSTARPLAVAVTTAFPEHKPLAGVQVTLYTDTVDARATAPLRSASTDANGRATLETVPSAGRYGVRARGAGAEPYFSVVGLRGAPSDSLEIRLVTQSQICY